MKLSGSRVFVRVPEVRRRSKWDRKADLGVLVGYENVRYRVLINNKVMVAEHVFTMFLEHNLKEDCSIRFRTYKNILKILMII